MTAPEHRPKDLSVTMAFEPRTGIVDLEDHLAALRDEAAALGYSFDRHSVRNELQAATFRLRVPAAVRLLVSESGALAIESTPQG